jgi:hypothetical protein
VPEELHSVNPFKAIFVPRHIHRAKEVLDLAKKKGFKASLLSDPETPLEELPEIAVFNSVGSLLRLYERCDLAIVGGSFISGLQGHNPLEPAACGRPMIFGPNMMSFHEQARALMESAACKMLLPLSLNTVFRHFSVDPLLGQVSGQRGRAYVAGLAPVAPVVAEAIRRALSGAAGKEPAGPPAEACATAAPAASAEAAAEIPVKADAAPSAKEPEAGGREAPPPEGPGGEDR